MKLVHCVAYLHVYTHKHPPHTTTHTSLAHIHTPVLPHGIWIIFTSCTQHRDYHKPTPHFIQTITNQFHVSYWNHKPDPHIIQTITNHLHISQRQSHTSFTHHTDDHTPGAGTSYISAYVYEAHEHTNLSDSAYAQKLATLKLNILFVQRGISPFIPLYKVIVYRCIMYCTLTGIKSMLCDVFSTVSLSFCYDRRLEPTIAHTAALQTNCIYVYTCPYCTV